LARSQAHSAHSSPGGVFTRRPPVISLSHTHTHSLSHSHAHALSHSHSLQSSETLSLTGLLKVTHFHFPRWYASARNQAPSARSSPGGSRGPLAAETLLLSPWAHNLSGSRRGGGTGGLLRRYVLLFLLPHALAGAYFLLAGCDYRGTSLMRKSTPPLGTPKATRYSPTVGSHGGAVYFVPRGQWWS